MLLKLRKPILKYTLNEYHVHWLSSFKHFKLPISIKIPVTIWQIVYLHDSYITKLNFMNYAFAKLVVAWLYHIYCNEMTEVPLMHKCPFIIHHGRNNYNRRRNQMATMGFQSLSYKPYVGIGDPFYLDHKKLILHALGQWDEVIYHIYCTVLDKQKNSA